MPRHQKEASPVNRTGMLRSLRGSVLSSRLSVSLGYAMLPMICYGIRGIDDRERRIENLGAYSGFSRLSFGE